MPYRNFYVKTFKFRFRLCLWKPWISCSDLNFCSFKNIFFLFVNSFEVLYYLNSAYYSYFSFWTSKNNKSLFLITISLWLMFTDAEAVNWHNMLHYKINHPDGNSNVCICISHWQLQCNQLRYVYPRWMWWGQLLPTHPT